jgi:large subunit ribosomal protein L13
VNYTLDATNESLGRLASKIAVLLRGKENPNYDPSKLPDVKVVVNNVSKIKITGNKLDQKIYYHYSGYPGGLKERKMRTMFENKPEWVLRQAVYRMLARNRLRSKIIKNLDIK